ncbi:hypothetical protein TJA_20680 [Thermus sp. LT1-2-5]
MLRKTLAVFHIIGDIREAMGHKDSLQTKVRSSVILTLAASPMSAALGVTYVFHGLGSTSRSPISQRCGLWCPPPDAGGKLVRKIF